MSNSQNQALDSTRRLLIWRYIQSILFVMIASAISIPVHYVIEAVNLVMIYLAAVVLAAVFLGRGPAILASVLSVLMFDFFLVEPRLSFTVADTQYVLTFFGLLAVGIVISTSVAQLRNQIEIVRLREAHLAALNSLSKDLTGAAHLDEILRLVVFHIQQSFGVRVVVLLPQDHRLYLAEDTSALSDFADADLSAAQEFFENTSRQTSQPDEENSKNFRYILLRTSMGDVGVLGLEAQPAGLSITERSQKELLQGFSNLAALAIERIQLVEQANQAQVLKNTERLQNALLNSISHEFRTPLVSITGTLSTLLEAPPEFNDPQSTIGKELLETAYGEARRLNVLVGNLLDMSRLESGALRLVLEPCDPQDLIGIALERFSERYKNQVVQTTILDDLPILNLDVSLMVQVLVNLLENAVKYSPDDSPVELICCADEKAVTIDIHDYGPGIPDEDLEHIFEKFYRSPRVRNVAGLGLGLSIARGIVEAHGGKVLARNHESGGLVISLALPIPGEAISS